MDLSETESRRDAEDALDDSESHSNLDSSDMGGSSTQFQEEQRENLLKLGSRETQAIRAWRMFMVLLIACIGIAVTTTACIYLNKLQDEALTQQYMVFTRAVSDVSARYMKNVHGASRNLAQTITSFALVRNQTFPFVTISAFETLARHARQQSGVIDSVVYSPLVSDDQRSEWEAYSQANQGWILHSQAQFASSLDTDVLTPGAGTSVYLSDNIEPIVPYIWGELSGQDRIAKEQGAGPYLPFWMSSPLPVSGSFNINLNQFDVPNLEVEHFLAAGIAREGVFTEITDGSLRTSLLSHVEVGAGDANESTQMPRSYLIEPVFERINDDTANVVGYVHGIVSWDKVVASLVPKGGSGAIDLVLKNSCGQAYTFQLQGGDATYMGSGDLHDAVYDDTGKYIALHGFLSNSTKELGGHCVYSCTMYVTSEYEDEATSSLPAIATTILALTFFVVIMIFILYDCFVERRNSILLETAEKSHNILSSLFPQNVRERLFADQKESELAAKQIGGKMLNLKSFVDGGMDADAGEADDEMGYKGRPIADLFTESTVLFADIAGFTAWSSQREPAQVFTLLETLYRAFDEIAKKRRVFKVETIGDCYVAVTGVPEPQKDHAVIMCRFARDMMNSCRSLTKKLETTLGPDTGELDMRIGLHSGPVTAGVLRGERSRFQLFGDTMNTASRTGNTGQKGKIQLSQETTDLLIGAGKAHWVTQRKEKVYAKGKGEMQTYWLSFVASGGSSGPSHAASSEQDVNETRNDREGTFEPKSDKQEAHMALEKTQRLVAWNSDVLLRLLKQIVARRKASDLPLRGTAKLDESKYVQAGISVIDEVREIITLPTFDRSVRQDEQNLELIKLDENVVEQVYDYVSNIAALYRNNPFHNFEHASHVTMSVTKLLSRIVAPSNIDDIEGSGKSLHDHTYGITNDPLTQFACVFSALIHDVDHPGVPNSQLIDEKTPIAQYYKNKSVAEQNSVDLAWKLLGDESYDALRSKIYTNEAEMKRFRELVVNSVMATDIVDKELKTLRNKRWEKAFSQTEEVGMTKDSIDRKATIVIEHLIQASDVAHTMQHWHIYRKWNERFFFECYKAYIDGRAAKDPSESWYVGEMGFFDFYIIPLAKKLKDCGVFGVSSDEYLNYAQRNRKEWEDRGRDVVHEMVEKAIQEFGRSCKEEPQAFL